MYVRVLCTFILHMHALNCHGMYTAVPALLYAPNKKTRNHFRGPMHFAGPSPGIATPAEGRAGPSQGVQPSAATILGLLIQVGSHGSYMLAWFQMQRLCSNHRWPHNPVGRKRVLFPIGFRVIFPHDLIQRRRVGC